MYKKRREGAGRRRPPPYADSPCPGKYNGYRFTGEFKIAVSENDDIRNIFTGRNLAVLDEILTIIRGYEDRYQNILKYILMSVLHLCKITDRHSNSQWPLWIPKTDCVEKNIIEILSKKVHKFNDCNCVYERELFSCPDCQFLR